MKWAKWLKESSKNSLKLNAASHNNISQYSDTDGFLEHSPSKVPLISPNSLKKERKTLGLFSKTSHYSHREGHNFLPEVPIFNFMQSHLPHSFSKIRLYYTLLLLNLIVPAHCTLKTSVFN